MTTLVTIRDRIRQDLQDIDPSTPRWSDDELDRHIAHALDEVSLAIPLELVEIIATTAGSRDIDVSGIEGLIDVEFAEYPVGQYPACRVPLTRWADVITLELAVAPTDGGDAAIGYTARHTLDGDGSTLPPFLEDLVVTGAAGYAVLEQSVNTVDTLNTGGPVVSERYEGWARARLIAFQQLLLQYGRANRVRTRRLRRPA